MSFNHSVCKVRIKSQNGQHLRVFFKQEKEKKGHGKGKEMVGLKRNQEKSHTFKIQVKNQGYHIVLYQFFMTNYPSQVFPFINYYPFLFYPPWTRSVDPQVQNANFLPNSRITSESQLPLLLQKVPEPAEEIAPASRKKSPKTRVKRRKEREEDYSRKHQKKDRNLPSNIFKILSNYIYTCSSLPNYVSKVDPVKVLDKFKELIGANKSYIRPATIQSLCSGGQLSEEESLVFRIVVRKFLLLQFPVIISQQPKLRKSQKITYLRLARSLERNLGANEYR